MYKDNLSKLELETDYSSHFWNPPADVCNELATNFSVL